MQRRPFPIGFLVTLALFFALAAPPALAQHQSPVIVEPELIDFGDVAIGGQETRQATVSSPFTIQLSVRSSNPRFTVSPSTVSIPSEGSAPVNITFRPNAAGLVEGEILFERFLINGNGVIVEARIPVRGTGISSITVSPQNLVFDPQPVGTTSPPRNITLSNPGLSPVEAFVSSDRPAVFLIDAAPVLVPPGGSVQVPVRFRPDRAGDNSAIVQVEAGAFSTFTQASGIGLAARVDPDPLVLPTTLPGCSSSTELLVTPFAEFNFLVGASNTLFRVAPTTFIASEPTPVTVTAPNVTAQGASGEIVVNAREGAILRQQIRVPASVAAADVQPSPASIDFGEAAPGTPVSRSVTIGAPSGLNLQFSVEAAVQGPGFSLTSVEGGVVTVAFNPVTTGPARGTLIATVTPAADLSCGREIEIPLLGQGAQVPVTLNPSPINFGDVGLGQTSVRNFTLTNETAIAFSATVSVSGPGFRVERAGESGPPQPGISVPPQGTLDFQAFFQPSVLGPAVGTASFQLTGSNEQSFRLNLALSGVGVEAPLEYFSVVGGAESPLPPGGSVQAPRTSVGAAAGFEVLVRNPVDTAVTVSQLNVGGTVFRLTSPQLPASIEPGGTLRLPLEFRPQSLGPAQTELTVDGAVFLLTGVGTLAGVRITGLPGSLQGAQQLSIGVETGSLAERELRGTLRLEFDPDGSLPADPAVQFASGGAETSFTVPARGSQARFPGGADSIGLQTGSTAGTLTLQASFLDGENDVTPAEGAVEEGVLAASPPRILSVAIESASATGFTIVVVGLSSTREVTQASVTFQPRGNVDLTNPTVTPPGIAQAFTSWFSGSTQFGGLFSLRMPFTFTGEPNSIASVAITLTNSRGQSQAATASVP